MEVGVADVVGRERERERERERAKEREQRSTRSPRAGMKRSRTKRAAIKGWCQHEIDVPGRCIKQ